MIAVISDVHGNLPALTAVLGELDRRGIQRIWCLGDTLGYGPFPEECLQLVAARCELVLAGNHDLAVRGDLDISLFAGSARAGVEYAQMRLSEQSRAVLATLRTSVILEDVGIELYHASARDPVWEYVASVPIAAEHLALQRQRLSFVGHSHQQLLYTETQGVVHGGAAVGSYSLGAGKSVANPGSVGQPRDGDPRAAFAVVTTAGVAFERLQYPVEQMAAAVAAVGLPIETAERLRDGI